MAVFFMLLSGIKQFVQQDHLAKIVLFYTPIHNFKNSFPLPEVLYSDVNQLMGPQAHKTLRNVTLEHPAYSVGGARDS